MAVDLSKSLRIVIFAQGELVAVCFNCQNGKDKIASVNHLSHIFCEVDENEAVWLVNFGRISVLCHFCKTFCFTVLKVPAHEN